MSCHVCSSRNEVELSAEVNIHFRGIVNIDKPGVLMFPKVSVCLDCGGSHFVAPAAELSQLARGAAADEASTRKVNGGDNGVFRRRFTIGV